MKEIRIIITSFNIYIYEVKMFTSKINEEGERLRKNNLVSYFCDVFVKQKNKNLIFTTDLISQGF